MKLLKSFEIVSLSIFTLFIAAGCGGGGGSDQPDLGTVTGVVTMDGQPLANVVVTFSPENGRPSIARTDESGNYELGYTAEAKGAVIGKHSVSIATPQENPTPPGEVYKDPVPSKYNTKTTLSADVKAGANNFDFQLESK
ncbi:hypothetical protein [Gimesia sp.]|uniref:hypothetical protein n=1 Tax=Gimesia sp. TaxID=2024833 RepID=UPI003A908DF0